MKKLMNFLPALMLMMVVTIAFAFTPAPKAAAHKAALTEKFYVNDEGDWSPSNSLPVCEGDAVLCAIRFNDATGLTEAEAEAAAEGINPTTYSSGTATQVFPASDPTHGVDVFIYIKD